VIETAASADAVCWRQPRDAPAGWQPPDARRWLQLALAGLWLLDAVLQFQPFMFTKGFAGMLSATAAGNPPAVATPVRWAAHLTGQHAVAANAAFATVQLLIALGIAWRPTVKTGLCASMAWALAVWWLGEGLGGVLTASPSAVEGAPGPVVLYALLVALLWPVRADSPAAPFVAARPVGVVPARLAWLALWGSLGYFTLRSASPQGLHDLVAAMAPGQPGWLAALDHIVAGLLAGRGVEVSAVLAVVLLVIAAGVFLPAPAARGVLVVAVAVAALIWVAGQDFGGILTGSGTDPNSGPLLGLLAAAYWPRKAVRQARPTSPGSASSAVPGSAFSAALGPASFGQPGSASSAASFGQPGSASSAALGPASFGQPRSASSAALGPASFGQPGSASSAPGGSAPSAPPGVGSVPL
jgi:hypothetical protein